MLPQAFIDLAERLIANEKNPEGFRRAISCAYYGAFLQAEDFLRRMNVFLITDKKHQELLRILADTGDTDVNEASAMLGDLRDERNRADYKLDEKGLEVEAHAQQCLDNAKDVLAKLNGCRIIPSRFQAATTRIQAEVKRLRGLP
jgi:uncharacterized protein (UPF0332 family)